MNLIKTGLAAAILWTLGLAPAHADGKAYEMAVPEQMVAAGSIGGSWFIFATAFFDLFSKNIEGLRYSIVPGGGISNPIAVQNGLATVAMGYTTMLHAADRGDFPFKDEMKDLRGIINVNVSGVLHAFVLADTGITQLSDFASKQYPLEVDTGPRGTGGELAASRALNLYGAGYDNIRDWGGSITHSNYREAINRMKDGHIEAFVNDDIIGNPVFVDLAASRDVRLLPLDQSVVDQLVAKFGYRPETIPANSYEGQVEPIQSTAQDFVLFCHKDVPEEFVYAMTELALNNREDLIAAHPLFANMTVEGAPRGFPIPLHPGAERYYQENGLLN